MTTGTVPQTVLFPDLFDKPLVAKFNVVFLWLRPVHAVAADLQQVVRSRPEVGGDGRRHLSRSVPTGRKVAASGFGFASRSSGRASRAAPWCSGTDVQHFFRDFVVLPTARRVSPILPGTAEENRLAMGAPRLRCDGCTPCLMPLLKPSRFSPAPRWRARFSTTRGPARYATGASVRSLVRLSKQTSPFPGVGRRATKNVSMLAAGRIRLS